ncbi:adenine phosphoribosyltransferase [Candidatus Poribacteria bacterium]|nr:adenine phosphoribosyltransferase [Candidatus Poribacteria bacterium]MYF54823.1 adenine phosphoribosyltransferase [Candidatus Poribacteria bacterium]MYI92718.1 adenine phosphoribosyltransferase [Candidatus Poribacteria bacterium]
MSDFTKFIRDIPNFPEPGVSFKDITPLLGNGLAFNAAIDIFVNRFKSELIDVIVGIDARGFILGAALAHRLGIGFVPIRKSGKLPFDCYEVTYDLEYGVDTLAIHQDAFPRGSRVLICDDVLATGGTLAASIELVKKLSGNIVGIALLLELTKFEGRKKVPNQPIFSLVEI